MVDATYRDDLRETNELNFARFDAKLEQRIAELDAKMEVRLAEQTTELRKDIRAVEKQIAAARADLIKWTFVFWSTTALAVIGLATRIL